MKCNVGGIDRILRIAVGALLVALAITNVLGWWAWLGLILLTTGLFRFCPAYPLLSITSCGTSAKGSCCK